MIIQNFINWVSAFCKCSCYDKGSWVEERFGCNRCKLWWGLIYLLPLLLSVAIYEFSYLLADALNCRYIGDNYCLDQKESLIGNEVMTYMMTTIL